MQVLKFGGSSLADAHGLRAVAAIIRQEAMRGPTLVVASAMRGVTDALLDCGRSALAGGCAGGAADTPLGALEARHAAAYAALGAPLPPDFEACWQQVRADLDALCMLPAATVEQRHEALATFSGWGERMVVGLLAEAVRLAGKQATAFAGEPVILHGSVATLRPRSEAERERALAPSILATRAWLAPRLARAFLRGSVPIAPGYIARDATGHRTTLGRNGSDYSATILAAALGATSVTIYSDVAGVYSADPHIVPQARLLPFLSYAEAQSIAELGARVLHPRTVEPVARASIALHLRQTHAPEVLDLRGTEIAPSATAPSGETPGGETPRWILAARSHQEDVAQIAALVLHPTAQAVHSGELEHAGAAICRSFGSASGCSVTAVQQGIQLRFEVPVAATDDALRALHAELETCEQRWASRSGNAAMELPELRELPELPLVRAG